MKFSFSIAILCIGFAGLFLSGCSYDEDLTSSLPSLYPPTGLQAASFDSTSILLTWNPSPSETDSRFQSYKLYWTYTNIDDSSLAKPDSVELPAGTSNYRVTGLANGVEYVFILYLLPQGEVVQVFPSIRWAPSSISGDITLPAQSILALRDTTLSPAAPSVIDPSDPKAQILGDLIFGTDGTLRSTGTEGAGWRQTLFSTITTPTPIVPVQLPSFPAVGSFTDSVVTIQPQTAYYCRTQDGHYARIYVKSIFLAGTSRPVITVVISYQTRPALPFAKRSQ